eukprot:836710-Pyramimonas_sp.AAC.1
MTIDHATIGASQKAILDSDDDLEGGGSPVQGGCSSAQPMSKFPDGMRSLRKARETTGMTPRPLTKKPK